MAATLATKPAPGLKFSRVFSKEGVHPYDQVIWERRDVVQKNHLTGETIFEQRGVEFPSNWSINASTIVTTKYFRGQMGSPEREASLKTLINRIVKKYRTTGEKQHYFASPEDAAVFADEMTWLLLNQVFSFNSPVWFNVGTKDAQQVSACYILGVEDTMESILNWYSEEGIIFKRGSGAGVNLSKIRGSKETLSSGGIASGPISFMRGADASAGSIKSGGACLAPWTLVYTTEEGPVEVQKLAERGRDFTTVSYNPILGRMQATTARAWLSGRKRLVKLVTDKGEFTLSSDHPVMLMSGGYRPVGDLIAGMSIRPGNITVSRSGVHRVGLRDGRKGKMAIARLVAQDVIGHRVEGMEVHHRDRNRANNAPANLEVLTRTDHRRAHATEDLAAGIHPLQKFHGVGNHAAVAGDRNGMSSASGNRTEAWRANQVAGMHREGVYRIGQKAAARQRMMNMAYMILNSGGSIDTFNDYLEGRIRLAGKIGYSKQNQLAKIVKRFGSYDAFRDEVRANNHRVVAVEPLEYSVVYDVEVDNDTPRDKSNRDGHNFLIVSETNDQIGFTGIMVSNTRRAAKMVVLDVDHPDIEEFVGLKAREEDKIRALRDAGFDMSLDGKDIVSVQYQNANNSVRVTDAFMRAVESNGTFNLIARKDGSVVETVQAQELWRKIAEAAWACADPGVQYADTINGWHVNPEAGPITASNPCSEYLSIDNSSCNLASLNLLKFLREDGTFDVARFVHAVEVVVTAMDISICFADFPTSAIGKNTRDFRQLGVGYANLGALLMALGHPYDSDAGRSVAAAITSLMSAVGWRRSAEMAGVVGPYAAHAASADSQRKIIERHRTISQGTSDEDFNRKDGFVQPIWRTANKEWGQAESFDRKWGYRNAQMSLLAPTGTIGFMMDCDTTGIEPDFSLVKFKKLVGGGSMQIVNQTVPLALKRRGYTTNEVEAIVAHIAEHGNVIDAPHLKSEHYAIFDTAMGERFIEPMGHVRMMAAVQPFLSGAISKTVNLPETATVEEIAEVYLQGWKLGLKALAVYRDNCKVGQPLSDGKKKAEPKPEPEVRIEHRPRRERLSRTRYGRTHSFAVGGADGYLTTGEYPDGRLGEVFFKLGKQGSTLAGVMDAFAISISIALQYGVPLSTYVEKFTNMKFEPAGMTDDPEVRMAQSLVDYMFKRLAIDYMEAEDRAEIGVLTTEERRVYVDGGSLPVVDETPESASLIRQPLPVAPASDAPFCLTCGTRMQRAGSCYACRDCGSTSGCS